MVGLRADAGVGVKGGRGIRAEVGQVHRSSAVGGGRGGV